MGPTGLAMAAQANDLEAVPASMRLPQWPTRRRVCAEIRKSWNTWASKVRVHPRIRQLGCKVWHSVFGKRDFPEPPVPWAAQEVVLREATRKSCVVVDDDIGVPASDAPFCCLIACFSS